MEELAAEVPQKLIDTVLPAHRLAATDGGSPEGFLLWKWDRQRWEAVDPALHPHTVQLRTALLAWGVEYNLTDDWLLDVALRTVWERNEWEREAAERHEERYQWKQAGTELPHEALEALDPPPPPVGFAAVPFSDIEPVTPFAFAHEQWVPWWRTWQEYEATLRAAFEEALLRYRRSRETVATRRGLSPSPDKREPELHLRWLVQFQVDNQTYSEIANGKGGAGLRTVQRAVKDMARLIGLTLRRKRHPRKPASRR